MKKTFMRVAVLTVVLSAVIPIAVADSVPAPPFCPPPPPPGSHSQLPGPGWDGVCPGQ